MGICRIKEIGFEREKVAFAEDEAHREKLGRMAKKQGKLEEEEDGESKIIA